MGDWSGATWRGIMGMAPFCLVLVPYGILFGVVATEAGLDIAQALVMSGLVIAGAAQFTALALMQDHAPTLVILATALAVNLRLAMYSAGLVLHFGSLPFWKRALIAYGITDQSYALAERSYEGLSLTEKAAFFISGFALIFVAWMVGVVIGLMVGAQIPPEYALDFALPILFISVVAPGIRSLPHIVGVTASVICGLAFNGIPFSLGLPLAAIVAVMAAAETERRLGGRT